MRLNMGCGFGKRDGWVNVDISPAAEPDVVCDLEQTPWPWPDDSAEQVAFVHSLEHMGADPRVFLAIMQELYRVCAPDAVIQIIVPHPRHDNFITDPTHVRAVTPRMLELFDLEKNEQWRKVGASNTPLAFYLSVDFQVLEWRLTLAEPFRTRSAEGKISQEDLRFAVRAYNNVAEEFHILLRARKPFSPAPARR